MSNKKIKLKNDKYRKKRGGYSRLLEIKCASCNNMLCVYQKDGTGIIKRMYVDRIYGPIKTKENNFVCQKCNRTIGSLGIYEKENRAAYMLITGSIIKKIIKSN